MKFFIIASVLAVATALPLEDTPEVKAAKAEFMAAFDAAVAGKHAELAPEQVEKAYLDDNVDVAEAKAEFKSLFDAAVEGKHAELAPKAAIAPVAPVTYTIPQPYYNAYYPNIYSYNQLGYYNTPYNFPYYNYNAFPYYNYQPFQVIKPVEKVEEA